MIAVMLLLTVIMGLSTVIIWGIYLIIDRLLSVRSNKPKTSHCWDDVRMYIKELDNYLKEHKGEF